MTLLRSAALCCAILSAGCAPKTEDTPALRALPVVPYPQLLQRERGYRTDARAHVDARIISGFRPHVEGAYTLDVTPGGVRIRAGSAAGVFYASETLEQLTSNENGRPVTPAVHVEDAPRFAWRGVQLDVARHWFDIATLERFVDLAARYKLNVVHLHLTDDNAWRLPSAAFPLLPSRAHYTVQQLRELQTYATRRFVTIVPEVDMPAHSAAAIRAYPRLGCGRTNELCFSAANGFAGTILGEVAHMFSSQYVHVGGDEVESWSSAQRTQFEAYVAATLRGMHRIPMLWDDEADAAPAQTAIEVWHLGNAAARAVQRGHAIVMAPDGPLYFNAAQGAPAQEPPASRYVSTLEQVYAYDPAIRPMGLEAAIWTEEIATPDMLWYMLLPRELALAENAWTLPARKSWPRFYAALPAQLLWLSANGYTARIPNVMFRLQSSAARYRSIAGNIDGAIATIPSARAPVALEEVFSGAAVFYRSNTSARWIRYARPFRVSAGTTVTARACTRDRCSAVSTLQLRFSKSTPSGSLSYDRIVSP